MGVVMLDLHYASLLASEGNFNPAVIAVSVIVLGLWFWKIAKRA
jgi:hypothetical protein